ncbi:hypothetical protein HGRIS_008761 [Hohenbuehelia grisea]|uniref:Uncharacterized protein n=1 Tax=Hohenbuehelia grisea TaxID=104357 RepID=A0ABR3J8Z6_9AGAR
MASCNALAPFADECRTAEQAAPFVNQAFVDYNITSRGEKAAMLSLMLFESGNFRFDKNHFPAPGRPGQGTRNLMAFPFVHQYAVDSPATREQALSLAGPDPTDPKIDNATMNAVRELVLGDAMSFASAMWFYKASGPDRVGCTGNKTLVDGLVAETRKGWEAFISGCVFTTVTEERAAVWNTTLSVLSS